MTGHPLRVTALVKQVPKGDHSGRLDADGRLERSGAVAEMNPWCRRAVAQAVRLAGESGGSSTVVTMGPPAAVDVLREALAWGATSAIQLSDPVLAGSDCLVTARALAATAVLDGTPDLILVGASSVDGSTGAVGAMIAELLGLPYIGPALQLEPVGTVFHATVQHDDWTESVEVELPAVVAVAERSCDPCKAPADSWPPASVVRRLTTTDLLQPVSTASTAEGRADELLGAGGRWGLQGSPTKVAGVRPLALSREPVIFRGTPQVQAARAVAELLARGCFDELDLQHGLEDAVPAEPVSNNSWPLPQRPEVVVLVGPGPDLGVRALLGEAAVLAAGSDATVTAIRTGESADARELSSWGADAVLTLRSDEPRPAAAALGRWMATRSPWIVLGAASRWDREVLARLGVSFGAGLMSDLVSLSVDGIRLTGLKPSGGGTLAEIVSHGSPQIATVRTGLLPLRSPRASAQLPHAVLAVDPDPGIRRTDRRTGGEGDALDRAGVVIGVGRGVDPSQYAGLEPLRVLLGAELAATRKVTDQGWLPHGRQVGITGRSVSPRIYLAVGVSGNQNHLAGASRAGTVVAINSDPAAPIFAHCDVGLVADWQEVMPHLVEQLGLVTGPRDRERRVTSV
ncbi:FAD-binding protein [Kribbella sp. NPDC051620]|uniref:FAD-binding protein n=1 Tax=Kribbella sp. NPDC051620 TaxID=3364120 RepID=UPI0037B96A54